MMGAVCKRKLKPTMALAVGLLLAACSGDGSDIGPQLARLPDASTKVLLLDDQNRGVVSGRVLVVGTTISALTGRNGRGDFLAAPRGSLLINADGSNGAAVAGDRLASLQVGMSVFGNDLPSPIHLPDLPDSASALVDSGLQAATTTITSVGGSVVTIAAGVDVINADAPEPVVIRVGELSPEHLPGDLPGSGLGSRLFGRGIFIDPPDALFVPGLDIDVIDDMATGSSAAQLYRLDSASGAWVAATMTPTLAVGGRLTEAGVLTNGGLYAFGVATTSATVTGRIVDLDGNSVPDAMVRVDARPTLSRGDGRFTADFVAATNGDGTTRSANIEVFAGGLWLPVVAITAMPITATAVDVGEIVVDTVYAGNVRVQQVVRARADDFRPARFSSLLGDVALRTSSDALGQVLFEDVPTGYFGFQSGRRRDYREVFYGQAIGFFNNGSRRLDVYQFLYDRPWFIGSRSSRSYVSDSIGGGPIFQASVLQGTVANEGYVDETRENGFVFASRNYSGLATATVRTSRDGRSFTHAFAHALPDSDHMEFPLQRVLREPLGAFDRHGLLAGTLTGVTPTSEHAIRVTRRISRQEWWDDVVDGLPLQSSLPVDIDPAVTHGPYKAGMAAPGGHLAAIEYTTSGGRNTLQKVGLLADFQPIEGQVESADVALDYLANTDFVVTGAAAGVDAAIDLNTLELSLGLELANSQLVDVARNLDGSYVIDGDDLKFTLPELDGDAAGGQWLTVVQGETVSGGVASSHASLLALPGSPTTGFAFPQFPELLAPPPDSAVSASGFDMLFELPAGAIGGLVELRSNDDLNDQLLWQIIVQPEMTQFVFVELPLPADTPLIAGRSYLLSITAWFGDFDIESPNVFEDSTAFVQSVGLIESGVTQISRRTISVTSF